MEREIVLTVNNKHCSNSQVAKEIKTISKMMPYIESFKAFYENNEVLDVRKRAVISDFGRLSEIYSHGINNKVFLYIVSKS